MVGARIGGSRIARRDAGFERFLVVGPARQLWRTVEGRGRQGGTELGITVMPSSTPPTPPGGPMLTVALLKKSASPFLVSSLALLISHRSRKKAIIAATKSA